MFNWPHTDTASSVDSQQLGNVKTSTILYLVSFVDFICRTLQRRMASVTLTFVDIIKAFDVVNHITIIKSHQTWSAEKSRSMACKLPQ